MLINPYVLKVKSVEFKEIVAFSNNDKLLTNFLNCNKDIILDIGAGYGELSDFLAKNFNMFNIISIENKYKECFYILKKIKPYKNVMLLKQKFTLLSDLFKNYIKKIKYIFLYFPDPWPKRKHIKNRLINLDFILDLINFKFQGYLVLKTDFFPQFVFLIKIASILNLKLIKGNEDKLIFYVLNNFKSRFEKLFNNKKIPTYCICIKFKGE